ncbi:MAG: hypothetical protein WC401_10855, partial [Bacteroidales bacterium]
DAPVDKQAIPYGAKPVEGKNYKAVKEVQYALEKIISQHKDEVVIINPYTMFKEIPLGDSHEKDKESK